jgi:hypothetical protein
MCGAIRRFSDDRQFFVLVLILFVFFSVVLVIIVVGVSRRLCRKKKSVLGSVHDTAPRRGHLSFKLVPRAKLVSYSVSLRLVFAHCGAWANDHSAPSMYGVWHHFHRCSTNADRRGDHFG